MRPKWAPEQIEARRRRAVRLVKQGLSYREVGQQVDCAISSISDWMQAYQQEGMKGLKSRKAKGAASRLSLEQKQRLGELLLQGPQSHGYADQLWTLPRIAKVIEKEFSVKYHPANVWKILRKMGWSCQKPERVAREQDAKKVQQWRQQDWPRIKQQARRGKKIDHLSG